MVPTSCLLLRRRSWPKWSGRWRSLVFRGGTAYTASPQYIAGSIRRGCELEHHSGVVRTSSRVAGEDVTGGIEYDAAGEISTVVQFRQFPLTSEVRRQFVDGP